MSLRTNDIECGPSMLFEHVSHHFFTSAQRDAFSVKRLVRTIRNKLSNKTLEEKRKNVISTFKTKKKLQHIVNI